MKASRDVIEIKDYYSCSMENGEFKNRELFTSIEMETIKNFRIILLAII